MPETNNPYAAPEADVADVLGRPIESPPLWNPNAAASWSLIFSPVFGALIQRKNWQALGELERAEKSKQWAIGSLVFLILMVVLAVWSDGRSAVDALTRVAGLALLITWYYSNGKAQQAYVLARFGKTYKRRGWGFALLCAVAACAGFLVVAALIGIVAAMLEGRLG